MICIKRKWKETRVLNMLYREELAIFASSFVIGSSINYNGLNKKYCFTFFSINAILKHVTYFLYVDVFFVLFDYEEKG